MADRGQLESAPASAPVGHGRGRSSMSIEDMLVPTPTTLTNHGRVQPMHRTQTQTYESSHSYAHTPARHAPAHIASYALKTIATFPPHKSGHQECGGEKEGEEPSRKRRRTVPQQKMSEAMLNPKPETGSANGGLKIKPLAVSGDGVDLCV